MQKPQRYCTDCNFMERVVTPDPDDWFCYDDKRYVLWCQWQNNF